MRRSYQNRKDRKKSDEDLAKEVPGEVVISASNLDDSNAVPDLPPVPVPSRQYLPRKPFISSGLLKGLENESDEHSSLESPTNLESIGKETAKFYEEITHKGKKRSLSANLSRRSKRLTSSALPPPEAIIVIEDEAEAKADNSMENPVLIHEDRDHSSRSSKGRKRKQKQTQFCNTCQDFFSCSPSEHIVSTVHQFSLQNPVKKSYVIPPSNQGYKMLKIAGWEEEQGLGKQNQGERDPVKTRLKPDRLGLGMPSPYPLQVSHSKELKKKLDEERRVQGIRKSERIEEQKKEKVKEFVVREALYRELPSSLLPK